MTPALHTCTEGFQFAGSALYDGAWSFCWAEIKHNPRGVDGGS